VFICIMCGAVSGFHALVASGTTPKMVEKETQVRTIGYGAMLIEGLVGVVALIAAASLPPDLYYDINVDLDKVQTWQKPLDQMYQELGIGPESRDPLHAARSDVSHMNLAQVEELTGGESLRGRTGGAVTLAVGMSFILQQAFDWTGVAISTLMKYWYHFAIMFEALFILTTIDAGNRIARFLVQETLGKVYKPFERPDWFPGALVATVAVTAGWSLLVATGSIGTIWSMFGIANQLLAAMALALVTTLLVNSGRGRYAWVTLVPMLFVTTTTLTAGRNLILIQFPAMIDAGKVLTGWMNIGLTLFVIVCVCTLLIMAASRWVAVLGKLVPTRPEMPPAG
jgi:carbon starvation protein